MTLSQASLAPLTRLVRSVCVAATLRRPSRTSDGQGGQIDGTPTDTTILAAVAPLGTSADEREIAARLAPRIVQKLVVLTGAGAVPSAGFVRAGDQILIGSRTFLVQAAFDRTLQSHLEVIAIEE